jgi:putative transposase
MGWCSRKVLNWRLSDSLEADFCVETLREAIDRNGKPEFMNSPSRDIALQCPAGQWIRAANSLALNGYRR